MSDCIFNDDNVCIHCGWKWTRSGKPPHRTCSNSIETGNKNMSNQKFPSLITRAKTYLDSREKWVEAGKPLRSPERIKEIYYEFCDKCLHHRHYCCDICGCFINLSNGSVIPNKIAWANLECPDNPPRWLAEPEFQKKIEEPIIVPVPIPPAAPVKKPCGCH